jgi:hypothetical protein
LTPLLKKKRIEVTNAYMSVEEPPDAIALLGLFFPAQNTDEHEDKKDQVRDKGGNDADFSGHRMPNRTNAVYSAPTQVDCA